MRWKDVICLGRWPAIWLLAFLAITTTGNAQTLARPVTLGWSPSPDTNIRGYAVYYGTTNQTTWKRLDTGTNLFCTIADMMVGETYRIYAVSYGAQGIESYPSNEVWFTPTQAAVPVPKLKIARQANGAMTLSYTAGTNQVCAIQFAATPDAAYWQTLTNVVANQAGDIIAQDFSASRVPQRFYRVALTPQPLLSRLTLNRQANGTMRLAWRTPPQARCRVQYAASPTATTWTTAATVTANDEGEAAWVDASAPNANSRFYRVALP